MPVRLLIHDAGVFLFTERNYNYLKRLFANFYRRFSLKNLAICALIFAIVYMAVLLRRKRSGEIRERLFDGKALSAAILSSYGYLLFLYTLVFRPVYDSPRYQLTLFWSYRRALNGSMYLAYAIILNYVMLMPFGILLPVIMNDKVEDKKRFLCTILAGFFISATIECLQLISHRGLFEFDDILGNVCGVVIGYGIYKAGKRMGIQGAGYSTSSLRSS